MDHPVELRLWTKLSIVYILYRSRNTPEPLLHFELHNYLHNELHTDLHNDLHINCDLHNNLPYKTKLWREDEDDIPENSQVWIQPQEQKTLGQFSEFEETEETIELGQDATKNELHSKWAEKLSF